MVVLKAVINIKQSVSHVREDFKANSVWKVTSYYSLCTVHVVVFIIIIIIIIIIIAVVVVVVVVVVYIVTYTWLQE